MTEEESMKKSSKILQTIILLLLFSSQAFAASPWTQEVGYGDRVSGKVVYGMANLWGGWISLFYEPINAHHQNQNIALGVGKGVAYGVVETLGGLAHLLTAPITVLDIPLPHNGVELS